jgi:hypothetical protein
MVITTFYGFFNISLGLQLNSLYTTTFWLSLLSITLQECAGFTTTFRCGKCSIFIDKTPTIIANRIGNVYILQSCDALTSETGTTTPMTVNVSNGSVFGLFVIKRARETPAPGGSVQVFAKQFPQLSP